MTTKPDYRASFPPPPKWATYQHRWRSNDFAKFRTHSTLAFAKRSIRDIGAGELYEWNGQEWVFRAEYPDQENVHD